MGRQSFPLTHPETGNPHPIPLHQLLGAAGNEATGAEATRAVPQRPAPMPTPAKPKPPEMRRFLPISSSFSPSCTHKATPDPSPRISRWPLSPPGLTRGTIAPGQPSHPLLPPGPAAWVCFVGFFLHVLARCMSQGGGSNGAGGGLSSSSFIWWGGGILFFGVGRTLLLPVQDGLEGSRC